MLVTLLTATGGRPEVFALCQKYIVRQTYKGPIQWIIVTDIPTEEIVLLPEVRNSSYIKPEIYKGPKDWNNKINTQRYNMDEAIKHVKGDYVFVIEDDDWYAPHYIENQLFLLQRYDVVGQGNSRYYNMKENKYLNFHNYVHTSLNETALKANKLTLLERAIHTGELYFDIVLWRIVKTEGHSHLVFDHIGLVTGMKSLPGKIGIGGGHRPDHSFQKDTNYAVLRSWVGDVDAKIYMDLMKASLLKDEH